MKAKYYKKVIFKPYHQGQVIALPPSLEELIPSNHQVRLINMIIERLNIDPLIKGYTGGGTSSYHPKMLLKVLIYGYTQRLYSSRRIAKALRENIHFMWLAGGNRPDFRTINRFRSSRLKGTIEEVFTSVLEFLISEGLINLRDYFLDGTKIEANANRYSYVWKKNTQRLKAKLQEQVRELLRQIEQSNEEEDRRYGDKDLEELGEDHEVSSTKLEQKVKELEERLKQHPGDKEKKRAVKMLKTDYIPRQQKYEDQEEKLGERNSYSRSDEDATFMRLKEDHLGNGQLKAGYNVQVGTEDQFIVGYSVHQQAGDSSLLIPHLEKVGKNLGRLPENVIGDSAYGSEENYEYLEDKQIKGYVKYNTFHYEQTLRFKRDGFRVENLVYDKAEDVYICPAQKKLHYQGRERYRTPNGYESDRRVYQAEDCRCCSYRSQCHNSKHNRKIYVSPRLNGYRQRARELLESKGGIRLRSRRQTEVESVFGQIKHNRHFRRFMLRGLVKVNVEFGLLSIAHNMMKYWTKRWSLVNGKPFLLSTILNFCFQKGKYIQFAYKCPWTVLVRL